MTDERITETTDAAGNTHTTHTVVTENEGRSGGTSWGLIIILIVLALGTFVVFSQMSDAEIAKDNAVAGAADKVGEAADQVGDAAQDAGQAVEEAVEN